MRWHGPVPKDPKMTAMGWIALSLRFFAAISLTLIFIGPIVIARACGLYALQQRIIQIGSMIMLRILGLRLSHDLRSESAVSVYVANHSSWLDIFVLYASAPAQFVAKREVSKWPGIGVLGQLCGTVFIERTATRAKEHIDQLTQRIDHGEKLMFFPEGTSTDGLRILPFRSTLFGAFEGKDLSLQSVYVRYLPNEVYDPSLYGLWGELRFARRIVVVLSLLKSGRVIVRYGPARNAKDFASRKHLAHQLEEDIRELADPQIASRSA
ncbi:MAG: lysophospholipid acyltransferase family protein [Pseudomonadota bacterium]